MIVSLSVGSGARVFVTEVTRSAPIETAVSEMDLFISSVYAVIVLGSLIGFTVVSAIRRLFRARRLRSCLVVEDRWSPLILTTGTTTV